MNETKENPFNRLIRATSLLTLNQIDACAYAMGCSGADWDKESIVAELEKASKHWEETNKQPQI